MHFCAKLLLDYTNASSHWGSRPPLSLNPITTKNLAHTT